MLLHFLEQHKLNHLWYFILATRPCVLISNVSNSVSIMDPSANYYVT